MPFLHYIVFVLFFQGLFCASIFKKGENSIMADFLVIAVKILAVLFSIVLHEVAHGAMAFSLGDNTAKNLGRLTLNPIKHLDFFGSFLLPVMLYVLSRGAFVFGYAKPVPYSPANLRDQKYGPAKVAAAGPLTNIAVAILFGLILRLFSGFISSPQFVEILQFVVFMNLVLAVFNLMPIPPLDGYWLVLTFVPNRYWQFKEAYLRFGFVILILFLFYGFVLIMPIVSWLFILFTGL